MSSIPAHTLTRLAATAVLALCLSATAFAAAPTDAQFQAAFQTFSAAQKGDSAAIDRSAGEFEALLKGDPSNPVLLAYTGAATAIKARGTLLPWKKIGHAEDGLAQIDKALTLLQPVHDSELFNHTPMSLQTRFTAASTFLGLPGMFNRGARGAKLLAEVEGSPVLDKASPGFQGAVLMFSAQFALKQDRVADARKALASVVERQLPQAEAARAQLQGLPQ
jgi:hypothetical protein